MSLPEPSQDARAHSARVVDHIRADIEAAGGWIPFARYMELALYAPGLGYYMAGARKLGRDGDFVTAPEISDLFGQTLAAQVRQVLEAGDDEVLEVGAGSGALAATLLAELERLGALPSRYLILELSPDLRARSRDTLAARVPHLLERVAWLNQLPPRFAGCVIGNEVLDAMPVHVVSRDGDALHEQGVVANGTSLHWDVRALSATLRDALDPTYLPGTAYATEIQLAARAFIRAIAHMLERGVALFVDYGFPQHEYYHAQRARGTLMCHYRHRAHDDPFFLPGLQDITSHIDFTAMARAAADSGAAVLGYTTQAQFLINCGIAQLLARTPAEDARAYAPLAAQVGRLTSPAEMGELFKVFAFGRAAPRALIGFLTGDKRHTL
ncbi:MAG: SAM-dependent methyltransferase [Betaproteobacteria bacterium]|nr:SAM-dependent methyltransferase [Betaproteobacteria bacterium]